MTSSVFPLRFAVSLHRWWVCAVLLSVLTAMGRAETLPATERVYLSGKGSEDAVEWEFFCSEGRNSGKWSKIRVPSCWEQEGFGNYQYGIRYYGKARPPGIAKEQGIYRRSFDTPANWQGRRVWLVFEGVMTDAHVRVNGIHANMFHQGGFYRFRYDITELVKFGGSNELLVTVDKESANDSVNLAERRADYWNFGGIFRPVWLEILPAQNISRVALDARADGNILMDVVLNGSAEPRATVTAQVLGPDGSPLGAPLKAQPAPGGDRLRLTGKIDGILPWTAETPQLYGVRITLSNDGVPRHSVTERIGFRTFEVRAGEGLFLNGKRILLKGVNRHSFWPDTARTLTPERNYADVRLIKEMNMNAVRMSHYPPDPDFLRACDELGLYVLNELGGWHGSYDTGVGRKLVEEMVTRDVNHPSILFWDNGNEGGWNTELDGEFAKWDPQNRPVLHPQKKHSGIETMHYRSYGEVQEYLRGREIYMPTEFLHGLYDGGHGAGLWDYWRMMKTHPRSGGGFLWVFADEGIARTDENGRIDNVGNYGADGIVGPRHEKEGSFFTVREIWSPVQMLTTELPRDFAGALSVSNEYDFINLERCRFVWKLGRVPAVTESVGTMATLASGEVKGPAVAPGTTGELRLPLPTNWREADVLFVTAIDPAGAELWTWSWAIQGAATRPAAPSNATARKASPPSVLERESDWLVRAGKTELTFSKANGVITTVRVGERVLPFANGPRFVAARRGDRTLDGTVSPEAPKGVDRVYSPIQAPSELVSLKAALQDGRVRVDAAYFGALRRTTWWIDGEGVVTLEYEYAYDGVVELMGVGFDYPESSMRSLRWLGRGPYRVWQNRVHGTTLGVWENAYNDPIPGESFIYPEFKGYFRDWRWARFTTAEGLLSVENLSAAATYLGVYAPRDGRDALLYTVPDTGLAFLDVIPAVRNKVNATDLVGPSSKPQYVSGVRTGKVTFRFESK